MNKFNLSFKGEILSDQQPEQVKRRFADLFGIADEDRLQRFFSGETIILRRNMERKEAGQWYQDMRRIGAVAELVKLSPEDIAREEAKAAGARLAPAAAKDSTARQAQRGLPDANSAGKKTTEKPRKSAVNERKEAQGNQKQALREKKRLEREKKKAEREKLKAEKARQALAEKARREEARQEAAARREAAIAEKRRLAEEAAARRQAQEEARREQERKEAAARAAREAAERQRKQAERQREQAERQREKAKRAREEAEQQKQAEARRKIEEQVRREHAQRAAAEKAARKKQQQEAEQKKAAALAKKKAAEKARKQQAEREAAQRKARAEQRAREEARRAAEEAARLQILRELEERRAAQEEERQRRALEEQAIHRGASELARGVSPKKAERAVRSRLELPQRSSRGSQQKPVRKRQSGEPNLYSMEGFRVSRHVRERATRARKRKKQGLILVTLAVLGLMALTLLHNHLPASRIITGPTAVTSTPGGELFLLAGGQLLRHDRAGVGASSIPVTDIGLHSLTAPIYFLDEDTLLARGYHKDPGSPPADTGQPELLRCELQAQSCRPFSDLLAERELATFAPHPLDGSVFVLDRRSQELLQLDPAGALLNRAQITLPQQPRLILDSGLLFINSASGPAVSVYRYDRTAFGRQLDEALLLPATALQPDHVDDFLRVTGGWWALMSNSDSGARALYRFNDEWAFLEEIKLDAPVAQPALSNWGEKVLVHSPRQLALSRYDRSGQAEVAFTSEPLASLAARGHLENRWRRLGSAAAGLVLSLLALAGAAWAYLNHVRTLVYKPGRQRGAQPVDDLVDHLHWVPPTPDRTRKLRTRSITCAVLALALSMVTVGLGASTLQLSALLLFLAGGALSLFILNRQPIGHIGVADDQLLIVDHGDMYHFGGDSDVQFRGNFMMIEDVVLYAGSFLWPTFAHKPMEELVVPIVIGGVRVDRKTLLVKMVERRHPLFLSGLCLLCFCTLALALLAADYF